MIPYDGSGCISPLMPDYSYSAVPRSSKTAKNAKKGLFWGWAPLSPPLWKIKGKKTAWALLNMISRGKKHVVVASPETNKMGAARPVASS